MKATVEIHPQLHAYTFQGKDQPTPEDVQALFRLAEVEAECDRRGRGGFGGTMTLKLLDTVLRALGGRRAMAENLVTTAGKAALPYNLSGAGKLDGDVIGHRYDGTKWVGGSFLVGSGTTAPALGDTGLATLEATLTDHWTLSTQHLFIVGYYLIGAERDNLDGKTVSELGIKTFASGSTKGSDDVLFARAVLYSLDRHAIDLNTSVVYLWNVAYRWAARDLDQGLDFGLEAFASAMQQRDKHGAVSHTAFGIGTTKPSPWIAALKNESSPRQATTYSAVGATLSASGTLAVGAIGGVLTEISPCVGATDGVMYQCLDVAGSDNTNNATAWSVSITFANVSEADLLALESLDLLLLEDGTDNLLLEG